MGLRFASYNVHKCLGTDRRRDPGRVIDVINATGADILALQEVDHRQPPRPEALPRAMIEAATDYAALPFATAGRSLGWHGQTILVRGKIETRQILRLALPGLEPRGAVLAELGLPDGRGLRVVGVHLGLIRRFRLRQMAAIVRALAARPAMPTVILGDFNEWSARGGTEPLAGDFRVHAPGLSFHANRPVAALDRVALGAGLHLRDGGVIDIPLARRASDHLPVWADVTLDRVALAVG